MDQETNFIQQFIQQIDEAEPTEEVINWLTQVCNPRSQDLLIKNLIIHFLKNINQAEQANLILKCLRKINKWIPQIVEPQLLSDQEFPNAIVQYLVKTNIDNYEGDGFILLSQIFKEEKFHQLATDQFITRLYDSLQYIDNEEIFQAVVLIIIKLSVKNLNLLEISLKHKNQRFFTEYLIQIINKNKDKSSLIKVLQFIEVILQKNKDYFYSNDFKVLQSIALRQIQDAEEETRRMFLKMLYTLIQYGNKEYLQKESILESMNEIQALIVGDKYSQKKSKEIVNMFNIK
ncbi:pre-rRNA processing [Paramecium bursaria]